MKPKAPKSYNVQDHQFFADELVTLLEREQLAFKKEINYQYSVDDFGDSDEEFLEQDDEDDMTRDEKRKIAQEKINNAVALTEEEIATRDRLLEESFHNWSRRDFTNFIHATAKYGRNEYKKLPKLSVIKTIGN